MSKILIKALAVLTFFLMVSSAISQDQFGGVTYRLGLSTNEVTIPVSTSSTNLTLGDKANDLVFQDLSGNKSRINVTPDFWRGNYIYRIDLTGDVPGDIIYTTRSAGQQFVTVTSRDGPVKVVLPEGYSTGNRLLGIARPDPDEVIAGSKGNGTELIWNNVSSNQILEVSYYRDTAPLAMMRIFAVIGAAALLLLAEYYLSMRRLRSIRDKDKTILR